MGAGQQGLEKDRGVVEVAVRPAAELSSRHPVAPPPAGEDTERTVRRLFLVLVILGGVLLGVTMVAATRPDRAPAGIVRTHHALLAPRAAVLRVSPAPGARAVPLLPLMRPRAIGVGPRINRALRGFAVPGGACEIAAAGCSLYPCVTYAGAGTQAAVLRSATVIVPAPGPPVAAKRPCLASAPAQRLVSARLVNAG